MSSPKAKHALPSAKQVFSKAYTQHHQTRWSDQDMYFHLNNSSYYLISDSIVNSYLISECGLEPTGSGSSDPSSSSSVIGLVISSSAVYHSPLSFPSNLPVALRVRSLGSSSVTYETSVFPPLTGDEEKDAQAKPAVTLNVTHVFVDRVTRRPVRPMPKQLREGLEKLIIDDASDGAKSRL